MSISRVLVVEDNHEVRRMVTASIKTIGGEIEVLDVPSAEEALVVSASMPLDLIVIDIRLPGMSGLDMVARLRKRKPDMKLILVTGMEDAEVRRQMAEAKADACFFKPIDIQAFLEAVKRSLSSRPQPPRQYPSPYTQTAPILPSRSRAARVPEKVTVVDPEQEAPPATSYERLAALKKQVKAVSAMLVNDVGQILEEAGSAPEIATGSPILQALMRSFRSSLQVSQAMARGTSECLQYFAAPRQCIYVAPVGMNHCLFVVTSGYFGPDKLGMIYHAIHLAVRDLQLTLAKEAANPKVSQQPAVPPAVDVDRETIAKVEGVFSQAAQPDSREQADGFWENVEKSGAADSSPGKEILTYDQARDLGLALEDDQGK
jgi:CheY-like chemotaxis protein